MAAAPVASTTGGGVAVCAHSKHLETPLDKCLVYAMQRSVRHLILGRISSVSAAAITDESLIFTPLFDSEGNDTYLWGILNIESYKHTPIHNISSSCGVRKSEYP